MPRKPRLHSPGGLYHDILRGKNRQDNLNDDVDRLELGSFVATGMEAKSIKSTPAPFTIQARHPIKGPAKRGFFYACSASAVCRKPK